MNDGQTSLEAGSLTLNVDSSVTTNDPGVLGQLSQPAATNILLEFTDFNFSPLSNWHGTGICITGLFSLFTCGVLAEENSRGQPHDHKTTEVMASSKESIPSVVISGMSMQGGRAPKNARSPHAYADGISLTSGPYLIPGVPRLWLADEHNLWAVAFNRFEFVNSEEGDFGLYDGHAWFGKTYDRLVVKAEGEMVNDALVESETDLLYSHAIATFWDIQTGIRHESSEGSGRDWLALGFQGLAPYWFEIDGAVYLGEQGRMMLQLEVEYELLFTQRLILQPRFEATFYGQNDKAIGVGSGLSNALVGLRLRYEFSRQFAPYVGVEWSGRFGSTADLDRSVGGDSRDKKIVAGFRFWF